MSAANSAKSRSRLRFWIWGILILLFVAFFVLIPSISSLMMDLMWYRELQRSDVFINLKIGPLVLGAIVGIMVFAIIYGNVLLALARMPGQAWSEIDSRLRENAAVQLVARTLRRIVYWGSALVALFFTVTIAGTAGQYWQQFLLFINAPLIGGAVDPIFKRDLSFYIFKLPVWQSVSGWLFTALMISLILSAVVYFLSRAVRFTEQTPVFAPRALTHLSVLIGLLLVMKAVQYYLGRFAMLYTDSGTFAGPSYTDVHARMPGLLLMAILALLAALFVVVGGRSRNILMPVFSLLGLLLASFITLGIYPSLVQRFSVAPNELARERQYIKNHITFTNRAYGLDSVEETAFSPSARVSEEALATAPSTVQNIRLWDYNPLLQVYSQKQDLRTYYDITNVDIDRYQLDGKMRQVMLAARELNVARLPGDKGWLNQHLIYTHGYGLVMSPVNEVDVEKGEPTFFISDIPPKSTHPELKITRPEIYFGEIANDYIIVGTGLDEFNYPSGDDNVTRNYTGTSGIPLRSPAVRAMAALRFGVFNLMISDYIKPQSKLIIRRKISERVQALAPFLLYDKDPYIVVGNNGRLYWMMDAYTYSTRFPYSRSSTVEVEQGPINLNYLRNSVKVVVDAYNGSVDFYAVDMKEPYVRAWGKVFPKMFKPLKEMPAGLLEHIRVAKGYFNTASEIYRRYHMLAADTFYQQEDLWDIPSIASGGSQTDSTTLEAYYLVMSLPGKTEPEFLLIRPYAPREKKNMIAWLSAANNPENYGALRVFNFPKQSLVFGPEQIQARINQDPTISSSVTLWNSSGSQVLWGNLLVIPVGTSILYVRPIYLQAQGSRIPELQRIIVADQQRVVMGKTLEEALALLTLNRNATTTTETKPTPKPTATTEKPTTVKPGAEGVDPTLARSALEHIKRADEAARKGDWATYGSELAAARRDLEKLNLE